MDYAPPIAITPGMNHLCVEIGTLVGSLESRVPPRRPSVAKAIHQGQFQSLMLSQSEEGLDLEGERGEEMSGRATRVAGEVLANCLYIQATAAGGGS